MSDLWQTDLLWLLKGRRYFHLHAPQCRISRLSRNAGNIHVHLERENAALERSWRHMINFWLDHEQNLADALTFATREYEARKDIFTCDTLAWALFKNGKVQEARTLINEAPLRTRTKDARINYHAGVIYKALNVREKAIQHLRLVAAINLSFNPAQAESAKQLLAELSRQRERRTLSRAEGN